MPPLSPLGVVITFLRSLLFALLFYALTVPLVAMAAIGSPFGVRVVGPIAWMWGWTQRLLMRLVLGQRVVIEGTLPDGPQFLVSKHEAMFETIDAMCLFDRPVIAAKRELMEIPFWGHVARAYGLITVDRKGGASTLRIIRAAARAAFADGRPVILYPEGTRVEHGASPELKSGFAGLYMLLNCPVIPIAIDSGRVSPRNSFLKRSGTITYLIGEPIPAGLPRAEAERCVHAAINALNRRDAAH
jgi:1-acyl-sn-glycerol-3-phosphate acyltransferase